MCTLEFMGQILRRQKYAFQVFEVCPVLVRPSVKKILTIDLLLQKIKGNAHFESYLPDRPKSYVTREFLYTIVNTIDSSFFARAE